MTQEQILKLLPSIKPHKALETQISSQITSQGQAIVPNATMTLEIKTLKMYRLSPTGHQA